MCNIDIANPVKQLYCTLFIYVYDIFYIHHVKWILTLEYYTLILYVNNTHCEDDLRFVYYFHRILMCYIHVSRWQYQLSILKVYAKKRTKNLYYESLHYFYNLIEMSSACISSTIWQLWHWCKGYSRENLPTCTLYLW